MLLLLACAPERLGIEMPEGGAATISQEDLQRDAFALRQEPPAEVFRRRMTQMHVDAVDMGDRAWCAHEEGPGAPRVLVAAWPEGMDGVVATAALISLAKAWDGPTPPTRDTWLCVARADATLPAGERVAIAPTEGATSHEAIDWRVVQAAVAAQFAGLEGVPLPPPPSEGGRSPRPRR